MGKPVYEKTYKDREKRCPLCVLSPVQDDPLILIFSTVKYFLYTMTMI